MLASLLRLLNNELPIYWESHTLGLAGQRAHRSRLQYTKADRARTAFSTTSPQPAPSQHWVLCLRTHTKTHAKPYHKNHTSQYTHTHSRRCPLFRPPQYSHRWFHKTGGPYATRQRGRDACLATPPEAVPGLAPHTGTSDVLCRNRMPVSASGSAQHRRAACSLAAPTHMTTHISAPPANTSTAAPASAE